MQIYLVGGAVRDTLLGRPILERDWVVVGATAEQMLSLGYTQVGKDFPVFLHPHSHEEYALARTERKSGRGYTGFVCHASPDVSLEEDLARRDLTINAMAMDDQGHIVDPYGGQSDLQLRQLRHVSPAFSEDPLRILRVARFDMRQAHLPILNSVSGRCRLPAEYGECWQACQKLSKTLRPSQCITSFQNRQPVFCIVRL